MYIKLKNYKYFAFIVYFAFLSVYAYSQQTTPAQCNAYTSVSQVLDGVNNEMSGWEQSGGTADSVIGSVTLKLDCISYMPAADTNAVVKITELMNYLEKLNSEETVAALLLERRIQGLTAEILLANLIMQNETDSSINALSTKYQTSIINREFDIITATTATNLNSYNCTTQLNDPGIYYSCYTEDITLNGGTAEDGDLITFVINAGSIIELNTAFEIEKYLSFSASVESCSGKLLNYVEIMEKFGSLPDNYDAFGEKYTELEILPRETDPQTLSGYTMFDLWILPKTVRESGIIVSACGIQ